MRLSLISSPRVTFLIPAFNRRDILLQTLARIDRCGLARNDYEVIVVDDASTDGTAAAVTARFGLTRIIHLRRHRGASARNVALAEAAGRYIVFLEADSYPEPGSIAAMIGHFERDPGLGAAVFTVTPADGSQECSDYPNIIRGCGTGFRHRALQIAGDPSTGDSMATEACSLSLRMLDAGWKVQSFHDLHVTRLGSSATVRTPQATRRTVRDAVTVAMRRFPPQWALPFAVEWARRERFIARRAGHLPAYWLGCAAGIIQGLQIWKRRPVDDWTFETFSRMAEIRIRLRHAKEQHGLSTVLLLDYGHNTLAYELACRALGLKIVAIADDQLAAPGVCLHGIPVIRNEDARMLHFDAAVVANLSPVPARARAADWQHMTRPVIDLFADDRYERPAAALANLPHPLPVARPA